MTVFLWTALALASVLAARFAWCLRNAQSQALEAARMHREAEERWRHTVDIASGVLIGVRPDGTIFEWNPQAERLYGLTRDQVVGEDYLRAAVPFEGREEAAEELSLALAGHAIEGRERFVTDARGRPRLIRWHVRRVCDAAGLPMAAMLNGIDVTEVHAAAKRFALLFEHSSDAHVLFDSSGVLDCNQAAMQLLGVRERLQLAGVHPLELAPPVQPNGLRSRDAAFMAEAVARRQGSHRFDWTVSTPDGVSIPVEMTLTPIPMEGTEVMLAVWHDLSRRRAAEEAERTTRLQLLQAIDAIDSGFAMYDAEERLVLCNAPYRALLDVDLTLLSVGTPMEVILGAALRPRVDHVAPDERSLADLLQRHRAPGPTFDFPMGETTQRITVQRTREGGRVVTHTDITSATRARDELERAHRVAEHARFVADDANRAKSAFLAAMSHELRTPLHSIIGFSRQLQRNTGESLPATNRMQLERIEWNGRHLLALIDNLLDLSKIESGAVQATRAPVDLEACVRATLSQSSAAQWIRIVVPSPLPLLETDAAKLQQLLQHVSSYLGDQARRAQRLVTMELRARATHEAPLLVARMEVDALTPHAAPPGAAEPAFDLVLVRALATLLGITIHDTTAGDVDGDGTILSIDFAARPASAPHRSHAA